MDNEPHINPELLAICKALACDAIEINKPLGLAAICGKFTEQQMALRLPANEYKRPIVN